MFFRTKKVKGYEYLQIVDSYRENGKTRQRVGNWRAFSLTNMRLLFQLTLLKQLYHDKNIVRKIACHSRFT
ncbi:MAG: hypothetical protein A2017_16445 [Lentisphaerae bacterium GWF2_44_16]|nr:MAG: hypothetical protein A2017_16445 [Lentisphaerae bacterium GWF2_44_16]